LPLWCIVEAYLQPLTLGLGAGGESLGCLGDDGREAKGLAGNGELAGVQAREGQ
jgi:hypothetical protein